MNYVSARCVSMFIIVVGMSSGVLPGGEIAISGAAHCLIALPPGILCLPAVQEDTQTVTCTFPGLSVVQLREHCLEKTSFPAISTTVRAEGEGAALVLDVASFMHPVVTIMRCPLSNHLIIGVCEQVSSCLDHSTSLGTIVHSI